MTLSADCGGSVARQRERAESQIFEQRVKKVCEASAVLVNGESYCNPNRC